jgi:DNA primase
MTSTDLIDEIRKRLDIVEIVSERIPVTGEAAVLKAYCPFHTPAEASLYVNRRQGFFHCFSCGLGGDAIKFVEMYDRVSYVEAATTLGARLGLAKPD